MVTCSATINPHWFDLAGVGNKLYEIFMHWAWGLSYISERLKRNKGFAGRWRALGLYSDILDHVIALQPVGGVGSTGANKTLPGSIVAA